jgi:hypothetical protein
MISRARLFMTQKNGLVEILLGAALLLCGCATSRHLAGTVSGPNYISAQGGFSVSFPVSAEVGGRVLSDTPQSVTFGDNWGNRITFSSRPFEARSSMMTMLETQGREKALSEFARQAYGNLITIHYHPEAREGAISFIVLRPVGPKTGVAAFLHGRRVYVVETDLLPGVQLLAQSDEQSQLDQEAWLEKRAVELAQSLEVK